MASPRPQAQLWVHLIWSDTVSAQSHRPDRLQGRDVVTQQDRLTHTRVMPEAEVLGGPAWPVCTTEVGVQGMGTC